MTLLELDGVGRAFRGGAVVRDVTFSVAAGEVVALVGLNGAGKTTAMRLALGMLRPARGQVRLFGRPAATLGAADWARVGALVDAPLAYPELTARDNLRAAAALRGAGRGAVDAAIAAWQLEPVARRPFRALSLGYRQRVGLAAALLHEPSLIVLDEPGNALDPLSVIMLREHLARRVNGGAGALISSHHLDEVARLADRILVMNAGRLIGELDPAGADLERQLFARVLDDDRGRLESGAHDVAQPSIRNAGGARRAGMSGAVRVEARKLARSRVGGTGSLAIVGGTLALVAGLAAAIAAGNPDVIGRLGPDATPDWAGLWSTAGQITDAGGLMGFGIVASWMFGREFADGTISVLFALPIGRGGIALAKVTVFLAWVLAVTVVLALGLLGAGLPLGYGPPGGDALLALARHVVLTILTGMLALPCAWVATVARSLLAGVACGIGLLVLSQVAVLAGAGPWVPVAAPVLWVMSDGSPALALPLALSVVVAAAFAGLTVAAWSRLQLDR